MAPQRHRRIHDEIIQQLRAHGLRSQQDLDSASAVLMMVASGESLGEVVARQPGTLAEGLKVLERHGLYGYNDGRLRTWVRWAEALGRSK